MALEVLPQSKTEVISSKYFVQYMFSASTIASRMSTIQSFGTGWAFTLSMLLSRRENDGKLATNDRLAAGVGLLAGVIVVFITRYEPKTEKGLKYNS